nr:hypothetical protein CFP56_77487 [Quercus suber]
MDCPTYLKVHGGLVMIPKRGAILTQRRKNRTKRVGSFLVFPKIPIVLAFVCVFESYSKIEEKSLLAAVIDLWF